MAFGRVFAGEDGRVVIWYGWRLQDVLVPNLTNAHQAGYDGTMQLGPIAVRFTLT